MKVVVVEDSPLKAQAVLDLLGRTSTAPEVALERSYQGALRRIQADPPDLIILDMTLPNFDVQPGVRTGKPRPLGGYDILRKLQRKSISTAVVILTQYESFDSGEETLTLEDLNRKCRAEFPAIYRTTIYFSPSNTRWSEELIATLQTLSSKND